MDEPVLNIDEYYNIKIEYLKLHGSIDWWIRQRDNRIMAREYPVSLMGKNYNARQMVYPIYDKKVSENPYAYLYSYFRKLLNIHDVYIVIGYSFRDNSINNAFKDFLQQKPTSRMIIVNRNPKSIANRIMKVFPNNRIDIIERPFGDFNLLDDLKDIVKHVPNGITKTI